ncbi:hypothetical protein CSUI_009729, partial [Cystoisospora suis]
MQPREPPALSHRGEGRGLSSHPLPSSSSPFRGSSPLRQTGAPPSSSSFVSSPLRAGIPSSSSPLMSSPLRGNASSSSFLSSPYRGEGEGGLGQGGIVGEGGLVRRGSLSFLHPSSSTPSSPLPPHRQHANSSSSS